MIEITIRNAFLIVVKLTWKYGFLKDINQSKYLYNVGNHVVMYLLQEPLIATTIISLSMIFGTTLWTFSLGILLGVLALIFMLLIVEGLAILIIIIMSCQGLYILILIYIGASGILLRCKGNIRVD